jgi:hypothetical protein
MNDYPCNDITKPKQMVQDGCTMEVVDFDRLEDEADVALKICVGLRHFFQPARFPLLVRDSHQTSISTLTFKF